jgi:glycosyltransferase involved in cell wall biosynthesis
MAVYLGPYAFCAANPWEKFKRAVKSFIDQEFKNAELIIISDNCGDSERIYQTYYADIPSIRFNRIEKQPLFGGMVRQTGVEMARGEIICYLDHDDFFGPKHLQIINDNFDTEKYDWIYYDDYLVVDPAFNCVIRNTVPVACEIGTSSIAHKRVNITDVKWKDSYGHDWALISEHLIGRPGIKIPMPQYYVCHRPGLGDF